MFHRIAVLLGLLLSIGAGTASAEHLARIGGDIDVSEATNGPVVAIGGNVTVSAPVAGNIHVAAGNVTITQAAAIKGDVSAAAGEIKVDGSIDGQIHAAGGHVRLNGPVTGDASIAAGTLELGPDARIQGKLTFRGEELRRDPAAVVTGGVEQKAGAPGRHEWHERTPVQRFVHGWFWTAGLMVLAAIIAAALPGPSNRMAAELRDRPWITLLLGFVAFVIIPVAAALMMITIIGIPIGILAALGYVVLLLLGYVWLAAVLGGMLLDRVKPEVAALAGWRAGMAVLAMLVIALLVRVPYVGGVAHFVALMLGVGMIAAVLFRQRISPEASPA